MYVLWAMALFSFEQTGVHFLSEEVSILGFEMVTNVESKKVFGVLLG